ncbi:expressed unknown protein [Seminavis robusta]|uniref:Uncharacterized protein n=1 Tax=Seminavis robusta TaxID=568900 RepID=A0A9N8DDP4_9STRA|nr:expressed unknown protein [Seminavis robusta]|eukprot:Sro94_g048990.1 n/a (642) ;mRNA; r:54658-56697
MSGYAQQLPDSNTSSENDDNATFCDDVSLEHRIKRTLGHSPNPWRAQSATDGPVDEKSPTKREIEEGQHHRHYPITGVQEQFPDPSGLFQQVGDIGIGGQTAFAQKLEQHDVGRNPRKQEQAAEPIGSIPLLGGQERTELTQNATKLQENSEASIGSINAIDSSQMMRDFHAALQQIEALQAILDAQGLLRVSAPENNSGNTPNGHWTDERPQQDVSMDSVSPMPATTKAGQQGIQDPHDNSTQTPRGHQMSSGGINSKRPGSEHRINTGSTVLEEPANPKSNNQSPGNNGNNTPLDSPLVQQQQQQQQIRQVTSELNQTKQALLSRDREVKRLRQELEQTKIEKLAQAKEIRRLGMELQEWRGLAGAPRAAAHNSDAAASPTHDATIVDRLTRIRDAADRASLVKDHHREIVRLKGKHEAAIQKLNSQHEERLQNSLQSTKTILSQKHKEILEGLQEAFDRNMTNMETRHGEEIERLKKEIQQGATLSDELLEASLSKINSGNQLLASEMAKNGELKATIKQLEQQLVCDKAELSDVHADQMESMKKDWEEQRNVMLDTMQQEFNDFFQQKRTGSPHSPTVFRFSAAAAGEPANDSLLEMREIPHSSSNSSPKLPSAYTGMDQELLETEALVHGLLGNVS